MKKLNLTLFTVLCAICMLFGITLMSNVGRASADVIERTRPTLSATRVMISKDGGHMLLATAIKDYADVYEVGYYITGDDEAVEPSFSDSEKYYTSIENKNSQLYPSDIFSESWVSDDGVGMIIWEIPFETGVSYEYKAYVLVGERNENDDLIIPATPDEVSQAVATNRTFSTITVAPNEAEYGSVNKSSFIVPNGSPISVSNNVITIGGIAVSATNTAATAKYTYGFDAFDDDYDGETVSSDMTITANFTRTINKYTITFQNSDGSTLQSGDVDYDETPSYDGALVYPNSANYNYVFTGWDDSIAPVSGAKTYTATYTTTKKAISTAAEFFDMNTIKNGTYYLSNDIDFDGETIKPIGVWDNVNEFTGTFDGKGYALLNVSVSDTAGGLFAANKGTIENVYVDLYSTGTLLSNVKRYGFVQINLEEGTISNVFSNFHQNHTSENDRYGVIYGAIAGQNYGGTIEKCVGEVTAAANLAYVYTDLIVGENNGTITNCYGITNGNSDLRISHRDSGTVTGAQTYADAILVIDDEVITAGNGFDMDYWAVSGSTMYMRTRAVVSNGVTVFTQDNVSDFFTTINANKSGYYVLGEDVDFTGVTAAEIGAWDGVNEFKGTFDGRGYKMTNLSISNSVRGIFYGNEGTVKNVYAEISTTTTINANQHTGFVAVNCAHGTVSDVNVRLTMDYGTNSDAYGMRLGAVVGSNKGGTIENCVGELIISNTVANEVIRGIQYLYVGLVVGWNDSGSVINSYGIKNGPVYADYNKTALNAVKTNAATVSGCAVYDNVKAMINADVVKAANGFNMRLWNVSDGKVYLGENIVGMTVFTQANISTFFTTIGKYVGGYYILGSDLDFTDVAVSKIGTWSNQYTEFYGTFDGQGYAMTGIKLTADNSCVFLANAGVIKNVYAEMTVVEDITADTYIGLVGMSLNIGTTGYSDGIVSNVYAKLNVAHNITSSRFAAAVVGRAFGTISNCIGEVVIGAGVSSYADTSAIYAYNNGATVTGCYGICANASIPTYSGVNNNYASASALVTAVGANITAENGFDMNYWSVNTDNNSISFGGKTI